MRLLLIDAVLAPDFDDRGDNAIDLADSVAEEISVFQRVDSLQGGVFDPYPCADAVRGWMPSMDDGSSMDRPSQALRRAILKGANNCQRDRSSTVVLGCPQIRELVPSCITQLGRLQAPLAGDEESHSRIMMRQEKWCQGDHIFITATSTTKIYGGPEVEDNSDYSLVSGPAIAGVGKLVKSSVIFQREDAEVGEGTGEPVYNRMYRLKANKIEVVGKDEVLAMVRI
ncbi:hypothetical protein B0H16DRAFT_1450873 [Mycena metata]|uniref:Uncharacterized protein n=1 Tax=Mycena metata TaxID=1033252 RepID=A0AAD7JXR5_9AGAR|nr:hypothetical protein B0H16DRAFT_1450873 [Mycena metata]